MKSKLIEISLEDYDEVEDEYEIRASREDYERESAHLLETIDKREEMVELLKFATPEKTAAIRELIAGLDESIEQTEHIVGLCYDIYQKRIGLWQDYTELSAMCDVIKPELLKHVAEHNPEKLEEVEAMLSDDRTSH